MAGFTYDNLVTDIRNYTEVDSNVLTAAIINRIIEDAEFRILRDVPIDAYKKQSIGNLVTGQNTINVPAQTLFVKGVQVYDSTSAATGSSVSGALFKIASTVSVPADAVLVLLDTPIYLEEGDVLEGGASANSDLTLFVSYEVIDDA